MTIAEGGAEHAALRDSAAAVERAARLRDRPLLTAAVVNQAAVEYATGRVLDALRRLDEAAAMVDDLDDHELAERIEAITQLGSVECSVERFDDARRHLERALALARESGHTELV